MSMRYGYCALAALALAGVSTVASAEPPGGAAFCDPEKTYDGNFDGRFYTVVPAAEISWEAARAAAEDEDLVHDGVQGRLATINSHAEDEYIHCLIHAPEGVQTGEFWVGGFQDEEGCDPESPGGLKGCGWQWLNGESIAATNTLDPYTNWQVYEPNDNNGPGSEQHLGVNLGGVFGWNDEVNLGNVDGFVVEYGDVLAPIRATKCKSGGSGCELGEDGPVITYPPQAVVLDEDEIEVRTWRFIDDDPMRCGVSQWNLGELFPDDGEVIIAPYLCSISPAEGWRDGEIVVTRTTSPVQIPSGVVQIVGTNKYGTDPNPHSCNRVDPPPPCDPTDQDIVVYRNTLAADQLEKAVEDVEDVDALFLGNVAETTHGVINPPRGAGSKGSYFIQGLRIQFPPGYAFSTNAAGHHTQMVALQRYKLKKAIAAVNAAKPALKPINWLALKVLAEAALYFHDRGNFNAALYKVRLLLKVNDKIQYKVITGNPHGEVAYRYLNAEDMYRRRIIPYN